MKKILWLLLLISSQQIVAQKGLNIVPMPAKVTAGKGQFMITPGTSIVLQGNELQTEARLFNQYLQQQYGLTLPIGNKSTSNAIVLVSKRANNTAIGAYDLAITSKQVTITGDNAGGVFYGLQTLMQLLPASNKHSRQLPIPQLSIQDAPRFNYRGMHLDVARHFMPVELVKKYIDYMATYKLNRFHWHLTEDQGWRIEIKKYPRLTQVGGWRNGTIIGRYPGKGNDSLLHGGFYTQEQIKEVVQYAADRHITVIPEIELPGHSSAAIAAYPELSCFPDEDTKFPAECTWAGPAKGKQVQQTWGVFEDVFCPSETTFGFLQDVLDEVMLLFPSAYIHIGGDECPKEAWKRSAFCQQLMKDKGLKDEHELQSYFIQRIEKYINSKGRKIIGWDEILEGGLAPNATVMSWRGEECGIAAARQRHHVIMTPGEFCYFDHAQTNNEDSVTIGGYLPLEKVYGYDPVPAVLTSTEANHILGAQANVWSEYIKYPSKLEYMIFPRMVALAEALWTPKSNKNWKDFERRLPVILSRLDKAAINYSKAYYAINATVIPAPNNEGVLWQLQSKSKAPITVNYSNTDTNWTYQQPQLINSKVQTAYAWLDVNGNKIRVYQNFLFNKATGKKITLTRQPSGNYPGNGAFTLVDAVQNTKGQSRSSEFIGFKGDDCEALIDLGSSQQINEVIVHTYKQRGSWILRPLTIQAWASADGKTFTSLGITDDFTDVVNGTGTMQVKFDALSTRFIKVLIKNWSPIPEGSPGAGHDAWLFVDEIEIN
jgi:hexosaminidase